MHHFRNNKNLSMLLIKIVTIFTVSYIHSASSITAEVEFTGNAFWELYFYINNAGTNNIIQREVEYELVRDVRHEEFKQFIVEFGANVTAGFNFGGQFEMINGKIYAKVSASVNAYYQKVTVESTTTYDRYKLSEIYKVNAGGKLTLYRKVIAAPGFYIETDLISSRPKPTETIKMSVTVEGDPL